MQHIQYLSADNIMSFVYIFDSDRNQMFGQSCTKTTAALLRLFVISQKEGFYKLTLTSFVNVSGSISQIKSRSAVLKAKAIKAGVWKKTFPNVLELRAK